MLEVSQRQIFFHLRQVLFRDLPDYVVFQESVETSKMYMKGVISIDPHWLPVFAEQHCRFEDPLDDPQPTYNAEKGECVETKLGM